MILFDQAGAGERLSTIATPAPALKGLVEHFWIQRAPDPSVSELPWRIVPDLSPQIIFVVSHGATNSKTVRCAIVGARSRFADICVADRVFTLGARLRPGSLPLLTRLPASDFTDRSVSIEEAFGLRGRRLVDRLAEQLSVEQAFDALSQFLGAELGSRGTCTELDALVSENDRAEVLAALLDLPSRTLYARMKEQVGLAPKRLLRIRRIHRTLRVSRDKPTSWAQLSAFCGFADQAHLAREFHDLLGESPTVWGRRSLLPISSRQ